MWKPSEVIPEHRWRARIVWSGLLLSITAYTLWQIWNIYDGYQNISTSLEVKDDVYEFPYVLVCFIDGHGCRNTEECVSTALEFSTVIGLDGEHHDDLVVKTDSSNCIGFNMGGLNVAGAGIPAADAFATIDMEWSESDASNAEEYIESIAIFTAEEEPTEKTLSFLYVPYSRVLPTAADQLTLTLAEMTIGKTTKKDLNGVVTTTFPTQVLSASDMTFANPLASVTMDVVFGQLYLTIRQGAFSRTFVEEISPLDVGSFLGNIGGFWELLIIFWGLLFIATREQRGPKLKARDFAKTIKTGKDIVTRRRSLSVDAGSEQRPHWDSAFGGSNNPPPAPPVFAPHGGATVVGGTGAAGFPMMPSVIGSSAATRRASNTSTASGCSTGHGHHRQHDSTSSHGTGSSIGAFRRPVASDAPRRASRTEGGPPGASLPLPPRYSAMFQV